MVRGLVDLDREDGGRCVVKEEIVDRKHVPESERASEKRGRAVSRRNKRRLGEGMGGEGAETRTAR